MSVVPVFYKDDPLLLLLLHLPSRPPCSPAGPGSRRAAARTCRTGRRAQAAAGRSISTSPRSSSPGPDQPDVIHTTRPRVQTTSDLQGCRTPHLTGSLCQSLGSRIFGAAVTAWLQLLLRLQLQLELELELSSTCFCPQRRRERRWTESLWMRASWMSWTVR